MNRIEPSSALVRNGSRSAGLDRAGPLVIWIDVPSSLGSTVANVVLPRPGGPSKRMCASGSLSFFDAADGDRQPLRDLPLADDLLEQLRPQGGVVLLDLVAPARW